MNRRIAMTLAFKAAILAQITDCTEDEAIRYLAAMHTTETNRLVDVAVLAGIPLYKVKELYKADSSTEVF